MRTFGFSTGAIAKGDFLTALTRTREATAGHATAIELSALRASELERLLAAFPSLDLSGFAYVALHGPSRLDGAPEQLVLERLRSLLDAHPRNVVMHPDTLCEVSLWRALGPHLCLENMDNRKQVGRTTDDLCRFFDQLPEAGFCLDLGHARQVDPTLNNARAMMTAFGTRLRHIHLSDVSVTSRHQSLSLPAILGFRDLAPSIPDSVPIIIESVRGTPASIDELTDELTRAACALPSATPGTEAPRFRQNPPPIYAQIAAEG